MVTDRSMAIPAPGTIVDCLVVGAGLSGIMAGLSLQAQGYTPLLWDKGRGLGGRLASRRLRPSQGQGVAVLDYGAPVLPFCVDQGSTRSMAQTLAAPLTVVTQRRVVNLCWQNDRWYVTAEDLSQAPTPDLPLEQIEAQRLILTAPLPQTLELLERSSLTLSPEVRQSLQAVTYHPCLALLLLMSEASAIPNSGLLFPENHPLDCLMDHQQRGISPQGFGVTLHASAAWSEAHWQADDTTLRSNLLTLADPWLRGQPLATHLHRWRYSYTLQPYTAAPCLPLPGYPNLVLAGDGFGPVDGSVNAQGLRVLGLDRAIASGLAAVDTLLQTQP